MTREIRFARADDAPQLACIDAQVSTRPWSEAHFVAACGEKSSTGNVVLVLEANNEVRGFGLYWRVLDEARINNIAVHPMYQGNDLGRQLLLATLDSLASYSVSRCLLEVRESNAIARKLYARCGFKLDGVRPRYYPSPVTRHPSPVTRHPSPVTRHPSPDTRHPTRDTRHATRDGREDAVLMSRELAGGAL